MSKELIKKILPSSLKINTHFATIFLLLIILCSYLSQGCKKTQSHINKKSKRRIVAMVPSAVEILYSLGHSNELVAVCDQCNMPHHPLKLNTVGSYLNPSIEKILQFEPSIVFLYETQNDITSALQSRGIKICHIKTENLMQLYEAIRQIGKSIGEEKKAENLIVKITEKIKEISAENKSKIKRKIKTAIVVDRIVGSLERIFIAGDKSYLGEILLAAGGENCFKNVNSAYPMVPVEAIAACGAEIIIDIRPKSELLNNGAQKIKELWKKTGIIKPDGTVKDIIVVEPNPLTVPGPGVVESILLLRKLLYDNIE